MPTSPKKKKSAGISGTIDIAMLSRAAQIFDQSADTIASELLQNARRAGATTVRISVGLVDGRAWCEVRDDGRGVTEFQALVTFGSTGWDAGSSPDEDYAGMGVFVLASRGCTVRSGSTRVDLAPEVFAGTAEARLTKTPYVSGTSVSFPGLPPRDQDDWSAQEAAMDALSKSFKEAALYFPIPVTINGADVPRTQFLRRAASTCTFEGVTIGAMSPRQGDWALINKPICYGGHLASTPAGKAVVQGDGNGRNWIAAFDIGEQAAVRLRLPTRDEAIDDAAWQRLRQTAKHHLVATITRSNPNHRLPLTDVNDARNAGFDARPPRLRLRLLGATMQRRIQHGVNLNDPDEVSGETHDVMVAGDQTANCMIVPEDFLASGAAFALVKVEAAAPGMPRTAAEAPHLNGCADYDALPRVRAIELTVHCGDRRQTYKRFGHMASKAAADEWRDPDDDQRWLLDENFETRPDRIDLTVTTTAPGEGSIRKRTRRYGPVSVDCVIVGDARSRVPQMLVRAGVTGSMAAVDAPLVTACAYDAFTNQHAAQIGVEMSYEKFAAKVDKAIRQAAGDEVDGMLRHSAEEILCAALNAGLDAEAAQIIGGVLIASNHGQGGIRMLTATVEAVSRERTTVGADNQTAPQ